MGLGFFWKEAGPTSNEHLAAVKKKMGLAGPARKDIGHGGTLDPFAEGWLLVAWEEGTKFLGALKGLSKTYIAEIYLGASTETLDNTIPLVEWGISLDIDEEKLRTFLKTKIGKQQQLPPLYSAKKVGGRASYELIRKGIALDLKPVEIEIFEAEHLSLVKESDFTYRWTVKLRVSAGTYIRCFARDWANELFMKQALLSRLARVGYGNFFEAGNRETKILHHTDDLKMMFHFVSDISVSPMKHKDRGNLFLSESGVPRAAWLVDSERWRYFNNNPLS